MDGDAGCLLRDGRRLKRRCDMRCALDPSLLVAALLGVVLPSVLRLSAVPSVVRIVDRLEGRRTVESLEAFRRARRAMFESSFELRDERPEEEDVP